MKQFFLAIALVIALPISALTNSYLLTERCDTIFEALESDLSAEDYSDSIRENWRMLRRSAAYTTPYDLIRSANNACEIYLSRLNSDDDPVEIEAALVQFRSAVGDLRRIHAFSLELIF